MGVGEIVLAAVESIPECKRDPKSIGFDVNVEFQPNWMSLGERISLRRRHRWLSWVRPGLRNYEIHRVFNYREMVRMSLTAPQPRYARYPCVTPSWDNSARRKTEAIILKDSTPAQYEEWLRWVVSNIHGQWRCYDEKVIFINGWNEWAEGNHLEPCQKWERAYLEATRRALQTPTSSTEREAATRTSDMHHETRE